MRTAAERVLCGLLFAAAAFFLGLAAVESGFRAGGHDDPVGPIDYEALWSSVTAWSPGQAARLSFYAIAAALGLGVLAWQLWPRRREPRVEIASGPAGSATLRVPSVARAMAARQREEAWVRSPDVRARLVDGALRVRARPSARRPVGAEEVVALREAMVGIIGAAGLRADEVDVDPRIPASARRVR